jgi:hypothetical protein
VWLGCLRGDASADALGAVGCDLEDLESVLDAGVGGAAPAPHQDMPRRNLPEEKKINIAKKAVLWIRIRSRIRRIRTFLDLLDTDPLVRGTDPDPAPDRSFYNQAKIVRKS